MAVGRHVRRSRAADVGIPVLAGDAVHLLFLAKGGLISLLERVGHIALLKLAVEAGIIKILLFFSAVIGLLRTLRGQLGPAAAAVLFAAQGALATAGAGAQLIFLVREFPFVPCCVGRAVDAAAQFLVTGAVIRRAAVGADNDVVPEGERLAAALTRAAIIFRHKFLP